MAQSMPPMEMMAPAPMRRPPTMQPMMQALPTNRFAQGKGTVRAVPTARPTPTMRAQPMMAPMQQSMAPSMGHAIPDGTSMVGTVKSFDPAKGFGFISAPNFPPDIYFKPDSEEVTKGQQVTFTIKWSPQGKPQAREVTAPMGEGDSYVGSVRRYNPNKGFGFLSVEGKPQDVYFKGEQLPPDLQEGGGIEGTKIRFTVHLAPDGKPQAQDMAVVGGPPQGMKRPIAGAGNLAMHGSAAKRMRPTPSTVAAPAPAFNGGGNQPGGEGERCVGQVKSYSPVKGFGFIQCEGLEKDVYFQKSGLPPANRDMDLQGFEIAFDLQFRPDGKPVGINLEV